MLDEKVKKTLQLALSNWRGDDLERSQLAFRGCSPEAMQQQWGNSRQTRQQILDGYQDHVDRIEEALKEILRR